MSVMKKLLYLFLTVLIVACSSEDGGNENNGCPSYDTVFNNYETALENWQEDATNLENCQAYYNAILDVIDCSQPPLTSDEIEGWQDILVVLGCPS